MPPRGQGHKSIATPGIPPYRRIEVWAVVAAVAAVIGLTYADAIWAAGARGGAVDAIRVLEREFPTPYWTLESDSAGAARGALGGVAGRVGLVVLTALLVGTWLWRWFAWAVGSGTPVAAWVGAAVGAIVYGVHPTRAALVVGGRDATHLVGELLIVVALLLLWSPVRRWRILGALPLAAGSMLGPSGLIVPILVAAQLAFGPRGGPGLRTVGLSFVAVVVGAGVAAVGGRGGWDWWADAPFVEPATVPFGIDVLLGAIGRSLQHLFLPMFSGVDYAAGALPLGWDWGDPGAQWLVAGIVVTAVLVLFALRADRGSLPAVWMLTAIVGGCAIVLPALRTLTGFAPGWLSLLAIAPAGLAGGVIARVIHGPEDEAAVDPGRIAFGCGVGILVVGTAVWGTGSQLGALRSETMAIRAARGVAPEAVALRWRQAIGQLRRGRNKRELKETFDRLVERAPRDAATWAERGRFYWVIRRFATAAESFARAHALRPDRAAYAYWLAAVRYLGRIEGADRALAAIPADARGPEIDALDVLVRARAGATFDTAWASRPPLVQRAIGVALTERGRYREALPALEAAAAARPDDAMIAAYRGWCELETGAVETALDRLRVEALADESGFLAHRLLGEYFAAEGPHQDRREAFDHLRYFIRHDPTHPDAPRLRRIADAILQGKR